MNWPIKLVPLALALCAVTTVYAESTIYLDLSKPSRQVDSATERLVTLEGRLHAYLAARQQPMAHDSPEKQLSAIAGEAQMVLDLATDYSSLNKDVKDMARSLEATIPARGYADAGIMQWNAGAAQMVRVSLQQGGDNKAEAALIRYLLVAMRTDQRNTRDLQRARAALQYQLNVLVGDLGSYRKWLRNEIRQLREQTNGM